MKKLWVVDYRSSKTTERKSLPVIAETNEEAISRFQHATGFTTSGQWTAHVFHEVDGHSVVIVGDRIILDPAEMTLVLQGEYRHDYGSGNNSEGYYVGDEKLQERLEGFENQHITMIVKKPPTDAEGA